MWGDFVADYNLGMTMAAETGYILYKNPDPNGKDTAMRAQSMQIARVQTQATPRHTKSSRNPVGVRRTIPAPDSSALVTNCCFC
jgi:hypothetical protein